MSIWKGSHDEYRNLWSGDVSTKGRWLRGETRGVVEESTSQVDVDFSSEKREIRPRLPRCRRVLPSGKPNVTAGEDLRVEDVGTGFKTGAGLLDTPYDL
jgi:hypothetical protein